MSGVTPPQPIADFPDHPYVRNEDIIRPKPRRLVDMRRSALGPDLSLQFSSPGASSPKMEGLGPHNNNLSLLSSSSHAFVAQLPPILPAKPFGNAGGHFTPLGHHTESSSASLQNTSQQQLLGKSLLNRAANTNSTGLIMSSKLNNHQQRPQSESPLYLHMAQNQHLNQQVSPSYNKSFGLMKGFGLNQRSVPNLPQLLQPLSLNNNNMYTPTPTPGHQQPARGGQGLNNVNSPQRRLFLSPQPNETSPRCRIPVSSSTTFGGSSGNILNDAEDDDGNMPYYSELTLSPPKLSPGFMPVHMSGGFPSVQNQGQQGPIMAHPGQKPRVRVEWKSVENLQKHNGPRLTTTHNDIDINGGPSQHVYNSPVHSNNHNSNNSSSGGGGGGSNKSFQRESFRLSHASPIASSTPVGFGFEDNKIERPEKSPEYDRIKTPSEIAQEMKERFANNLESVHYVEPNPPKNTNLNLPNNNNSSGTGSANKGVTATNNTLNTTLNHLGKNETDCNSLGRSSTSDGDFGTLGGSTGGGDCNNMYTVDAGSTPSSVRNKSRHSAPSSKLKSRRKNILHNLNSEEMRLLNSGGGNGPKQIVNSNNTGTGGSSSDGSSGHASMSDSQTSGSPPAEYVSISGAPSNLASTNNAASPGNVSSGYKSVLKSVPEDETHNGSNASGLNSSAAAAVITTTSPGRVPIVLGSEKSANWDRKSLDTSIGSGSKKSSRSTRHRNKEPILLSNGNSGLEDIKQAIEQLTLRSSHGGGGGHLRESGHHSSYSTSTYSSMSGSECDRHRRPHVIRYSSHDTINTQVTSADEFVWVDSHSRLVELQNIPWTNQEILKVVEKSSKLRDNLERISMETVPRVSYLLQRALVRVARETQRFGKPSGFCSKQEVSSALKIVLSPALADSCSKSCLRAAAMFSVSTSDPLHRESKSARSGLNLHVGRFHRWMVDVRLGRFVHEFAAIHLTASMENLIEEILGQSLNSITINSDEGTNPILTAALLEQAISNNGDLWGLLQPYAHLNAGRTASGALALPRRWASAASVNSSGSSSSTIGPSPHQDDSSLSSRSHSHSHKSLEQSLLTTCVGSIPELAEILSLVSRVHYKQLPLTTTNNGSKSINPTWSPSALHTLFYFMRCSQLENSDDGLGSTCNLGSSTATLGTESVHDRPQHHGGQNPARLPVQELVYERPFIVLPPLIEWVRVASAHADHRHSGLVDKDDVMQAARMLLPGIDCPVRFVGSDEFSWPPRRSLDEFECNKRLKIDLAFKMLTSGRSDLVAQALLLMPPSKANTFNETGLSPLILASIRGEETMVRVLLDAGAEIDAETPPNGPNFAQANSETQHWTALTFSALMGHAGIVKLLLERNSSVEGGAKLSEEKSTQTPLQVASASGNMEIVQTLLGYGANPFMSTLVRDSLCYTGSAQRGSFSAISVAASHGHRSILHKLLAHPFNQPSSKEVLSLEEILAEGAQPPGSRKDLLPGQVINGRSVEEPKILSKTQVKVLQEAMYQSAENGHIDITLDLRNMGVPWTLHCWINSLATAHELRCEPVINQLLQDFLHILQHEDFSQASFVEDCLPLLFNIFRQQNEGTTLLLADIFQTCYGRESIKEIRDTSISNGTRIDPKYVNNQELSDVQFRVEGRVFFAHKIVLVTSSQRFKSMLKSATDSNPPVLQINDIRYPTFQMVMEYLYNGSCDCIRHIGAEDVLELMAAANFFQLDGLLRFCESRCSQKLNIESIVSMYIHAKVYNAIQLLEYCQGFLLQNMVALLTFDDSVRRLIFGKKLHNHDVLAGLLLTLQARLKSRPSNSTRKSK